MQSSYYWKVSEISKHRKYAEVSPSLIQQLVAFFFDIILFFFIKCKITSLLFPSRERL